MKSKNDFQRINDELAKKVLPTIGDNLVMGHEFLEDFKALSAYFLTFGAQMSSSRGKAVSLVGLLPVNDPGIHYYSTGVNKDGQAFVSVWLMEDTTNRYTDITFEQKKYEHLYAKFLTETPVVLYFMGRDDGSFAKRFSSEEEAFEYLKNVGSLDNFIEQNIGNFLFQEFVRKKEPLNDAEFADILQNSIVYWN